MPDAKKDDLVQIHTVILKPSDRADNLPSSTKLYDVTPKYEHDFGTSQEVLLPIGNEAWKLLEKK